MGALQNLVDHWREIDTAAAPYVHPADAHLVHDGSGFKLNALPYPYVGDLARSDIWVLMLNSNIGQTDEHDESTGYFRKRLIDNLRQELSTYEFPMLSLDPALAHTGTYAYYNYRNGLGKVVAALAERANTSNDVARRELAGRISVVQLFPYRSRTGVPGSYLKQALPSVRLVREAVHEAVAERLVIVPRSARDWGFEYGIRSENLLTYGADQARSASLSPGGRCGGGDAVLARLDPNNVDDGAPGSSCRTRL